MPAAFTTCERPPMRPAVAEALKAIAEELLARFKSPAPTRSSRCRRDRPLRTLTSLYVNLCIETGECCRCKIT